MNRAILLLLILLPCGACRVADSASAILAEIVAHVFTIELVQPLAEKAAATLAELGYTNVHTRVGNGFGGWPEEAPFQAIIVTAAP